jgi:hypothetical protein
MKLLIAGSRNFEGGYKFDMRLIEFMMEHGRPSEVVCGMCATGADKEAVMWAKRNKITVREFPANWSKHNKAAGPIRNREMAQYCDRAIIFWDAKSRGTKNMIEELQKANKPYNVVYHNPTPPSEINNRLSVK